MKLSPWVEVTRPINVIIAIFSLIAGINLCRPVNLGIRDFFALLTVALITAGGNSLNDYFDRKADEINRPKRPIPSERINPKIVIILSPILLGGGILTTLPLSFPSFLMALLTVLLLTIYNSSLKKLPLIGNFTVALLAGFVFLFIASYRDNIELLIFPFLLVFFFHLAREIIKDIEDMEGDKKIGAHTLPLVLGVKPSLYLGLLFSTVFIAISILPFILGIFSIYYLLIVSIFVNLPLIVLNVYALKGKINPHRFELLLKLLMFPGLISLFFAR